MKKKKSVSFSFDDDLIGLMDKVRHKLRLGNRSAVIRRALVLLELAVTEEEKGKQLCLKNGDEIEFINLK